MLPLLLPLLVPLLLPAILSRLLLLPRLLLLLLLLLLRRRRWLLCGCRGAPVRVRSGRAIIPPLLLGWLGCLACAALIRAWHLCLSSHQNPHDG